MASIFDLEIAATGINDALRANREGNAARRAEALKNVFSVLEGAQSAAQTRETIGREGRARAGFPTELGIRKEEGEQAKIKTQTQRLELNDILGLRKFLKTEHGIDVPPEKLVAAVRDVTELETLQEARAGGLVEKAAAGQVAEAGARKPVAESAATVAGLQEEVTKAKIRETKASAFRQEEMGAAVGDEARGTESGIDRTRRVLTELQYPKDKIDAIVEQQVLQEAKIRTTGQDLATDVIMLSKAIEVIETRATVQEVVAASAEAGGVEASAAKWLADMLGGSDAVLTPEQRDASASRLRQLRNELANQHNAIPGIVPINIEAAAGEIPLDQAIVLVEDIISDKRGRGETALSPQEEASLQSRKLEIFIPLINTRLQSGAQDTQPSPSKDIPRSN